MSKELEQVLKESLLADNKMLAFNMQQFEKGYVSKDHVDQIRRQIDKSVVDLDLLNTDLKVLKEHTKKSEMARLEGELKVAQAQFEASDERAEADASRRDRAVEEKAFAQSGSERWPRHTSTSGFLEVGAGYRDRWFGI